MRILLLTAALLLSFKLAAEDTISVQATVFDASEDVVVKKEDLDGNDLGKIKTIKRRSACRIIANFGQDAELSIKTDKEASSVRIQCDLEGNKIKFRTRWLDQDENAQTGLFAVTGVCGEGESAVYKAKNARTGRIDYFYLTFTKLSAAGK